MAETSLAQKRPCVSAMLKLRPCREDIDRYLREGAVPIANVLTSPDGAPDWQKKYDLCVGLANAMDGVGPQDWALRPYWFPQTPG
jgi:hypothetical protein